jgi:Protein of unknown function (DUF4232)
LVGVSKAARIRDIAGICPPYGEWDRQLPEEARVRGVMSRRSGGALAVLALGVVVAGGGGVAAAQPLGTHAVGPTPRCLFRNLRLPPPQSSSAAGTTRVRYVFWNVGPATCSFFGYPGMGLVNKYGQSMQTLVIRAPATPYTVLVPPGGRASFYATYSDVPRGAETCPAARSALVWPPNDYQAMPAKFPYPARACGGRITVLPVVGGVQPL